MTPPLNAIAALLLDDVPNTYCYPCLAFKLQVTEEEARRAAEPLVLLDGFQINPLRCADCGREDDLLQLPSDPPTVAIRSALEKVIRFESRWRCWMPRRRRRGRGGSSSSGGSTSVGGYYRKDGTYVAPHQRTNPDRSPYNNYDYPGNYNPNKGTFTPGSSDTYLERYNEQSR
jgi:hypothetical protein